MVFCDVLFYDDGKAGYKIIKVTIKKQRRVYCHDAAFL